MRTEMDALVIEDFVLEKGEQDEKAFVADTAWQEEFQLD